MKKYLPVLFLFVITLIFSLPPVFAGEKGDTLCLLGDNNTIEIINSNQEKVTLKLDTTPVKLLLNRQGQKIFLCGFKGVYSERLQSPVLKLLGANGKMIQSSLSFDSEIAEYWINRDKSVMWAATKGNRMNKKNIIDAKLYRVNLETLSADEIVIKSGVDKMAVSNDEKWLAVSGGGKVNLYDLQNLNLVSEFECPINLGMIVFNEDSSLLMVAGYGTNPLLKLSDTYYYKSKIVSPGSVRIYNLTTFKCVKSIELGAVTQEFTGSAEQGSYYVVTVTDPQNEPTESKLLRFDFSGITLETKLNFLAIWVRERPGKKQLFVTGAEHLTILEQEQGTVIKELTIDSGVGPVTFVENLPNAYMYNLGKGTLSVINLNNLEIAGTETIGRSGAKTLKTLAAIALIATDLAYSSTSIGRDIHSSTDFFLGELNQTLRGNMVSGSDQKKLYLLNSNSGDVSIFDTMQNKVVKIYPATQYHRFLQLSPNRKYLVEVSAITCNIINCETDERTVPKISTLSAITNESPRYAFSPKGDRLYFPNGSKIIVLDLETGNQLEEIKTAARNAYIFCME